MNTNQTPIAIAVSTVACVATDKTFEPVTIGTRATKNADGTKKVIPADQRTRSILIPVLAINDVPSKYQVFLLDGIRKVAKAQLTALWDADAALREVPANIWTVDALLAFAAREAESKKLSTASVTEWFKTTALHAAITAKNDATMLSAWTERIVGLAAATIGTSERDCETIIATLQRYEDDAESIIGQQLIAKLQKRVATLRKQMEEVSLDSFSI